MSNIDLFMPLYIGRYLGDTGHLTTLQHGAYMLLLMHYWCKGPLPDDDGQLAAIARLDLKTWRKAVGPAVRPFFRLVNGLLHQKRADLERDKANEISSKRREAGKAGAYAKHGKPPPDPSNGVANAMANATDLPDVCQDFATPPVPINQYQATSTEKRELINKNPLPLKDLVGSRARDEAANSWEKDLGIEPPKRDDNAPISDNPAVVAIVRRTAKACSMRTDDYGVVRSADAQIVAIEAQPQVVGADVTMGLKWQPADPIHSVDAQQAAAIRDASPDQIERARRAFQQRAAMAFRTRQETAA